MTPKPVPTTLRPIELDRGAVDGWKRTQCVDHVDVRLVLEQLQLGLEPGVLTECLDERGDPKQGGVVHLVQELLGFAGSKASREERLILVEIKLGAAHQETIWSKTMKWFEPTSTFIQAARELVDVFSARGYQSPTVNGDFGHIFSGGTGAQGLLAQGDVHTGERKWGRQYEGRLFSQIRF